MEHSIPRSDPHAHGVSATLRQPGLQFGHPRGL